MHTYLSRREFIRLLGVSTAGLMMPSVAARQNDLLTPIIVDGHIDMGYNLLAFERDYTRSALDIRAEEDGTFLQTIAGQAMLGQPEWLRGRVALMVGVIFALPRANVRSSYQEAVAYSTIDEAEAVGLRTLDALQDLTKSSDHLVIVRTDDELDGVLATWEPDAPEASRQIGIVLAMEGADPIRTPDDLADWYDQGLRSIGLSWGRTRYAGSNFVPGPLTDTGVDLLSAMADLNMILDTAHLSEEAFWGAMDVWEGATSYTHGNARHFLPGERGLSDEQINAIIERDGVVGIGIFNGFFTQNRINQFEFTLDDLINAIDYVCQLTGTCDHVAIGSDLDGGFGAASTPAQINTAADLRRIPVALAARGYSATDIDAIAHGNWLRLLRQSLPINTD